MQPESSSDNKITFKNVNPRSLAYRYIMLWCLIGEKHFPQLFACYTKNDKFGNPIIAEYKQNDKDEWVLGEFCLLRQYESWCEKQHKRRPRFFICQSEAIEALKLEITPQWKNSIIPSQTEYIKL